VINNPVKLTTTEILMPNALAADKIMRTVQIIPDGDVAELYDDNRRRFDGTNGDADDGESTLDTEALPCFSVGTENDFARRS